MARSKPYADPRGGHIRIYWKLVDSVAFRALSHSEVRVYLAMRRRLGKTNNGDISASLTEMRHAGIRSSSTLAKALRSLEVTGFIAKTRQGGIANGGKECSLYRFTDEETFDMAKVSQKQAPPTNEWAEYKSISQVSAALRSAHDAAKRPAASTPKVRKPKRTASKSDAESKVTASRIEHGDISALRDSKPSSISGKRSRAA